MSKHTNVLVPVNPEAVSKAVETVLSNAVYATRVELFQLKMQRDAYQENAKRLWALAKKDGDVSQLKNEKLAALKRHAELASNMRLSEEAFVKACLESPQMELLRTDPDAKQEFLTHARAYLANEEKYASWSEECDRICERVHSLDAEIAAAPEKAKRWDDAAGLEAARAAEILGEIEHIEKELAGVK